MLIDAAPHTSWLQGEIPLDAKGFVLTGPAADCHDGMFETRREGVFAVGDVRSGSVKRVRLRRRRGRGRDPPGPRFPGGRGTPVRRADVPTGNDVEDCW